MSVVKGPDNKQLLSQMVGQYEKDLLRICYVYLRDVSLAEDAVQETFLKAFKHLSSLRGENGAKPWLIRIAVNVCRDMNKSTWYRYVDRRIEFDTLAIGVEGVSETSIALMTEIMRLPYKECEVLWLHYYEDMKLKDIAQSLGITIAGVSARLNRARNKLQTALGGMEDE